MTVDRKALNILLAALDIERRELAELMGYEPKYLVNVLNGFTSASPSFRTAFGDALAKLLLGPHKSKRCVLPAKPLAELLRRTADARDKGVVAEVAQRERRHRYRGRVGDRGDRHRPSERSRVAGCTNRARRRTDPHGADRRRWPPPHFQVRRSIARQQRRAPSWYR